jgi:hypothetical protein
LAGPAPAGETRTAVGSPRARLNINTLLFPAEQFCEPSDVDRVQKEDPACTGRKKPGYAKFVAGVLLALAMPDDIDYLCLVDVKSTFSSKAISIFNPKQLLEPRHLPTSGD